jgi:hypothetical protein
VAIYPITSRWVYTHVSVIQVRAKEIVPLKLKWRAHDSTSPP